MARNRKAIRRKGEPKIDVEEFLKLADSLGYSASTIAKIKEVLEKEDIPSPWLVRYHAKKSKVEELEEYATELFGMRYALAVNSGMSAPSAAYVGCGTGPGDEIIVPGYTLFATAVEVVVV